MNTIRNDILQAAYIGLFVLGMIALSWALANEFAPSYDTSNECPCGALIS